MTIARRLPLQRVSVFLQAYASIFNRVHIYVQQLLIGMGHCISTTTLPQGAISGESQDSQRLRYASFPVLHTGLRVNMAFG
jgi:hypothetical protein